VCRDSEPGAREKVKEGTGSKEQASSASLETPYARVSVTFYMLSGLQHFQTFSVRGKGYIVAVAGPCGDAYGRHAAILLTRAV